MQIWKCNQGTRYMQIPETIQHPQEEGWLRIRDIPVPPVAGIPKLQPVPFPEFQETGYGLLQKHVLPFPE